MHKNIAQTLKLYDKNPSSADVSAVFADADLASLTHTTTLPGGFGELTLTVASSEGEFWDWRRNRMLSRMTLEEAGGRVIWEGRVEAVELSEIWRASLTARGYWSNLNDAVINRSYSNGVNTASAIIADLLGRIPSGQFAAIVFGGARRRRTGHRSRLPRRLDGMAHPDGFAARHSVIRLRRPRRGRDYGRGGMGRPQAKLRAAYSVRFGRRMAQLSKVRERRRRSPFAPALRLERRSQRRQRDLRARWDNPTVADRERRRQHSPPHPPPAQRPKHRRDHRRHRHPPPRRRAKPPQPPAPKPGSRRTERPRHRPKPRMGRQRHRVAPMPSPRRRHSANPGSDARETTAPSS